MSESKVSLMEGGAPLGLNRGVKVSTTWPPVCISSDYLVYKQWILRSSVPGVSFGMLNHGLLERPLQEDMLGSTVGNFSVFHSIPWKLNDPIIRIHFALLAMPSNA